MADHSGWSDLPVDLFSLIFSKLSLPQLLRSAAVCVSWSAAVHEVRARGRRLKFLGQCPWLMFGVAPDGDPSAATFYSVDEHREYTIPIPDPPISHRILIGTDHGWVITADASSGLLRLLNPITGSQIDLPSAISIIRTRPYKSLQKYLSLSVALSADPSLGVDYTVLLVNYYLPGIFFNLSGHESWSPLIDSIDVISILFHKGKLFATSSNGSVYICVFDEAQLRRGEMPNFTEVVLPDDSVSCFHFLAETPRGDLLIFRMGDRLRDVYTILPEEENLDRVIQKAKVSGEVIVFVCSSCSLFLSACDFPLLTPNSIYFVNKSITI